MFSVDVLIGPLHILARSLGTGVLPADNPASRIRSATGELESVNRASQAATRQVAQGWSGSGADAAIRSANTTQRALAQTADTGPEIAGLVETAAGKVKHAADQINGLIDDFGRAARALGPNLLTPGGLAIIVPVALGHILRGTQIVMRAQADLAADTTRMRGLGRHAAPGRAHLSGDASSAPVPGGVPVRLPDGSVSYAPNQRAAAAVRAALSQRGVPYVWGGTTPKGFDCSGFTQWAYKQAGLDLPRLAQDQDTAGDRVSQAQLRPGDLAVWDGHVAMYVGHNQLVEAGDPVQVSPLRTSNAGQGFQGFFRPR